MPKKYFLIYIGTVGILIGCAPIKEYVGDELPPDQVALVRVSSAEDYWLRAVHVQMMHPQTQEWIDGRGLYSTKSTDWVSVVPPSTCITVRARPVSCHAMVRSGCTSWDMSWAEGKLCFDVDAGSNYEIQALSEDGMPCGPGIRLTGFRAVELESKELLATLNVGYDCPPPAE